MSESERRLAEEDADISTDQYYAALRRIERRDWWLWVTAVIVMILLTVAVGSLSLTVLLKENDRFFQFNLGQAVSGLVGIVLLFSTYVIYQQVLVKRLRRQLAEEIIIMARLRTRAEEFYKLATVDPRTGLYNRRFVDRRLAAEINRCRRYSYPLTVLLLEVNDYNQFDSSGGRSTGDKILREFAERLTQAIRISDTAVHMGSGEFLVLLPECAPERAQDVVDRLGLVEVGLGGQKISVPYSAGWANYQFGDLPRELLERAEQALDARVGKKRDHLIKQVS